MHRSKVHRLIMNYPNPLTPEEEEEAFVLIHHPHCTRADVYIAGKLDHSRYECEVQYEIDNSGNEVIFEMADEPGIYYFCSFADSYQTMEGTEYESGLMLVDPHELEEDPELMADVQVL